MTGVRNFCIGVILVACTAELTPHHTGASRQTLSQVPHQLVKDAPACESHSLNGAHLQETSPHGLIAAFANSHPICVETWSDLLVRLEAGWTLEDGMLVSPAPEPDEGANTDAYAPTPEPDVDSTSEPTPEPDVKPTSEPTPEPDVKPTSEPTPEPDVSPPTQP